MDESLKLVRRLVEKIGSRVEQWTCSAVGYADMGGPQPLYFTESCLPFLSAQKLRVLRLGESLRSPEALFRIFREGCPNLHTLTLGIHFRRDDETVTVLLAAQFPSLRILVDTAWTESPIYAPFCRKVYNQLDYVLLSTDTPATEEWMTQLIEEDASPSTLLQSCLQRFGAPPQKILAHRGHKDSLLGRYMFQRMTRLKSADNATSFFKAFVASDDYQSYPNLCSFNALETIVMNLSNAMGADASFIAEVVEWILPFVSEHASARGAPMLWAVLYQALAAHGIQSALLERCFSGLVSSADSAFIPVDKVANNCGHAFIRLLQLPNEWATRHLDFSSFLTPSWLNELGRNNANSFDALLIHPLFDSALILTPKGGRVPFIAELIKEYKLPLLQTIISHFRTKIETLDLTIREMTPLEAPYIFQTLFNNPDLVALYRRTVADWRLIVSDATLKTLQKAPTALSVRKFIESYGEPMPPAQLELMLTWMWRQALVGCTTRPLVESHIKSILEAFPSEPVPGFVLSLIRDDGGVPTTTIMSAKPRLPVATLKEIVLALVKDTTPPPPKKKKWYSVFGL